MPTVRILAAALRTSVLAACLGSAILVPALLGQAVLGSAFLGSAFLGSAFIGQAWAAGGRAALVVGNAAYPDADAPLPTPVADARAVGDELKRRGFTVVAAENAGREALQAAIDRFVKGVEPDGIALVYFGGYGIQAGRKNYLMPVDARVWNEADVVRDGVSVDGLLDELAKRRAGIRVVVLDASRRNPFERRFRSFSQGLAPATGQAGTMTFSSAAAGGVVNEGGGAKSAFATELLQQIASDQTADGAFAATRDALVRRGRNVQPPALTVNLDETFSFDPDRPRTPAGKAAAPPDDSAVRAKEARDREARDRETRDREARDREARDREARDREAEARAAASRERDNRDREARDRETRDREAQDRDRRNRDAAEQAVARSFEAAQAKGTADAFRAFLDRNPTGPTAEKARSEIARIEAEERQAAARRKDDEERQRRADLDRRILKDPRDEAAYYERGQFHAQRGDTAAAIADFDHAIRLNPRSPEAFNNRCFMRAVADDLKRALTDCNEALKLRPGFLDALDSRGLVNLKAGSLRAAVSDYGEALKLDPRHSSALYGRGLARRRLGEDTQASRDMASALELNPEIDKEFAAQGLR